MIQNRFLKENKILIILVSVLFLCTAVGWVLYTLFGHQLIRAMYEGNSIGILNRIIKEQAQYPLEYYFEIANKLFYRILFFPLCSFLFYIFLFKLYKYFFKKTEWSGGEQLQERETYFKYDLLAAGILYLSFTLLSFYPCLKSINTSLIGPPEDNMYYFWNMWWADKAVAEPARSLSFSNYIFYPEGSSLLYHFYSFYNLFLSVILRPFINPITIYNLLILHTFVLSGVGAFLLVRYLTRNSYLGLIGGFIFAFNPSHFAHSLHHINISSIQFIPFFVLFFIKTVKGNSKKDLFLACLFFFLNSICSWYYLFYAVCFIVFSYIYLVFRKRQLFIKDILLKAGIIIGPTMLALSPWLAGMIFLGLKYPHLLIRSWGYKIYVTDSSGLILPHPYHWLAHLKILETINSRLKGFNWEKTVYLGIINISIILFTFKGIIRKTAKYFLGFFTFLIFSMGSFLHGLGWTAPIILPHTALKFTPFLLNARNPSRMIVYVYLFLSVIIAFALKHLTDSYKSGMRRNCLLATLILLLLFDYYSVRSSMTKVYLPSCYKVIKKEKGVFGILDLPGSYTAKARYMMYQTYHGFPIVQGHVSRRTDKSLIDYLVSKDLLKQKKQLIDNNVKYIIIHKRLFPKKRHMNIIKRYAKCYRLIYEDKESVVFQVYNWGRSRKGRLSQRGHP